MDFLDVGKQCKVCKQHDYLPFKCDCCGDYFCLEHRDYVSHKCPKAGEKRITTKKCPICKKEIRIDCSKDNITQMRHHIDYECTKEPHSKVVYCPVKGCNKKLYESNSLTCSKCHQLFCIEHRFPDTHNCSSEKKIATSSPSLTTNTTSTTFPFFTTFRHQISPLLSYVKKDITPISMDSKQVNTTVSVNTAKHVTPISTNVEKIVPSSSTTINTDRKLQVPNINTEMISLSSNKDSEIVTSKTISKLQRDTEFKYSTLSPNASQVQNTTSEIALVTIPTPTIKSMDTSTTLTVEPIQCEHTHTKDRYCCQYCRKIFTSEALLKKHIYNSHPICRCSIL